MNYIDQIKERVKSPKIVNVLSEDMMWQEHGSLIWQAECFEGTPFFYPVYRFRNYYSYSILALIIKKNYLMLSKTAFKRAQADDFALLANDDQIDGEIERVGGPYVSERSIREVDEYCHRIVDALRLDVALIEDRNQGYANIIMCGGKDSLNLLLLNWKNPVIALSAQPNYPFVCDFVKENNLDIEVRLLEDKYNEDFLNVEMAELCARHDATHWRWSYHIHQIADEFDHKLVIWKGQMADLYMTNRWKKYTYLQNMGTVFLCKLYNKLSPVLPSFVNIAIANLITPMVDKLVWQYGASAQGAHIGFIRSIADCLVLSAYHGCNMSKVLMSADLARVAQKDIRSKIGAMIFGKEVKYPRRNPAPKPSLFRRQLHKPELLIEILRQNGIKLTKEN